MASLVAACVPQTRAMLACRAKPQGANGKFPEATLMSGPVLACMREVIAIKKRVLRAVSKRILRVRATITKPGNLMITAGWSVAG